MRPIKTFLRDKMVFLAGPRQVGKTSLCLHFLKPPSTENPAYLNWDDLLARDKIKKAEVPVNKKILCFDEIHKFKNWRSLIKGLYDTKKYKHQFLVTGSARLDYYRRGGDSLLGRYRYLRLHPLTLGELSSSSQSSVKTLLKFGGFPEPFFKGTAKNLRLWHKERVYRIIHDDLRDLDQVKELSSMELLADALPFRVGAPLSIKNLADDLLTNHSTIRRWVQILDNIYYSYRISPYGAPKIRAVKKEQKLYLWDWSSIEDSSFRFENMVASHLLKYCHFLEDTQGFNMELRFLRDTDKREVDFVVLKNKKALFAVECKTGEKQISPHINYFKARTNIPKFYQVHLGSKHVELDKKTVIIPFRSFCSQKKLI
ncbi:MAG: AAA family ATPase [Bdellovibrionaceae bacterium]|nr:AAA family ATPase [Pseudobdellovibrionaceae bacterium]